MKKHLLAQITNVQNKLAINCSIYRETNDIEQKLFSLIDSQGKNIHKHNNNTITNVASNLPKSRIYPSSGSQGEIGAEYNDNELTIINQQLNQLIRKYIVVRKRKKGEEIGPNDMITVDKPVHKMVARALQKLTTKQEKFYDIARRCRTRRTWDAIQQHVKKMVEQQSEKLFYMDSLFIYKPKHRVTRNEMKMKNNDEDVELEKKNNGKKKTGNGRYTQVQLKVLIQCVKDFVKSKTTVSDNIDEKSLMKECHRLVGFGRQMSDKERKTRDNFFEELQKKVNAVAKNKKEERSIGSIKEKIRNWKSNTSSAPAKKCQQDDGDFHPPRTRKKQEKLMQHETRKQPSRKCKDKQKRNRYRNDDSASNNEQRENDDNDDNDKHESDMLDDENSEFSEQNEPPSKRRKLNSTPSTNSNRNHYDSNANDNWSHTSTETQCATTYGTISINLDDSDIDSNIVDDFDNDDDQSDSNTIETIQYTEDDYKVIIDEMVKMEKECVENYSSKYVNINKDKMDRKDYLSQLKQMVQDTKDDENNVALRIASQLTDRSVSAIFEKIETMIDKNDPHLACFG